MVLNKKFIVGLGILVTCLLLCGQDLFRNVWFSTTTSGGGASLKTLTNDLVMYIPFDSQETNGIYYDESLSAPDFGTNSTGSTSWAFRQWPGVYGGALLFGANRATNWMRIPLRAENGLTNTDFTIGFWLQATNIFSLNGNILSQGSNDFNIIYSTLSPGSAQISVYIGGTERAQNAINKITTNKWHWITVSVSNSTSICRIEVDGNATNQFMGAGVTVTTANDWEIGNSAGSGSGPTGDFVIDELHVWKQFLTDSNRIALYNSGATLRGPLFDSKRMDMYVSTTGSAGASGQFGAPMSIDYAMTNAGINAIGNGSNINVWLMPGSYVGGWTNMNRGTNTAYVNWKPYGRGIVFLQNNLTNTTVGNQVVRGAGRFVRFNGFTMMCTNDLSYIVSGSILRPAGWEERGYSNEVVNCRFIGLGNTIASFQTGTGFVARANMIIYSGWSESTSITGTGYGFYGHNDDPFDPPCVLSDNIIAAGHAYNQHSYGNVSLYNVLSTNNIEYLAGAISSNSVIWANILVGADNADLISSNFTWDGCIFAAPLTNFQQQTFWCDYGKNTNSVGLTLINSVLFGGRQNIITDWQTNVFVSNNVVCNTAFRWLFGPGKQNITFAANSYYGSQDVGNGFDYYTNSTQVADEIFSTWQARGYDATSTYTATNPAGSNVWVKTINGDDYSVNIFVINHSNKFVNVNAVLPNQFLPNYPVYVTHVLDPTNVLSTNIVAADRSISLSTTNLPFTQYPGRRLGVNVTLPTIATNGSQVAYRVSSRRYGL